MNKQELQRVIDLTDSSRNYIYNMTIEEARNVLRVGDIRKVRAIDGQFALVAVNG